MTRSLPSLALLLLFACADGGGARTALERPLGATPPAASGAGLACAEPAEGCACAGNQPPVACRPSAQELGELGELDGSPAPGLCLEGTRRCVAGVFGPCEDVRAFEPPSASISALIDQLVSHPQCEDCDPFCFIVRDELSPDDGPLEPSFASGVAFHASGGGITLEQSNPGAPLPPILGLPPLSSLISEALIGRTSTTTHRHAYTAGPTDVYVLAGLGPSLTEERAWIAERYVGGAAYLDGGTRCVGGDPSVIGQGVTGALRCMIDDVWFGSGSYGDIPFVPYSSDAARPAAEQEAQARANVAFSQDAAMSSAPAPVKLIGGHVSTGDPDVAGSQIPALYSLVTGAGMDMGVDRRSVPAASGCPDGTFGHACFREDADRVVVLLMDAPMHNGPNDDYDYDPGALGISLGTGPGVQAVPPTNDSFGSAHPIAEDAATELAVFTGSTAGFSADVPAAFVGCGANEAAPDAVFAFDVVSAGGPVPVQLSARGTSFPAALAVVTGPPAEVEALPGAGDVNERFESAHDLGDVTGRVVRIAGDTTHASAPGDMAADYQGSLIGASCGANTLAPDAVYAFDVASAGAPVDVRVRVDMGGSRAVVALYEDTGIRRWPALAAPLTATGNRNALPAHVFEIPSGPGNEYVSVTGDTRALGADYDHADLGGAQCSADDAAYDAAFRIHVEGTRTLRFDTEGSRFDTVLSLHDRPPLTNGGAMLRWPAGDTHNNENEDAATAYDVGDVNGRSQVFEGDTTGMRADVTDTFGCGTQASCGDAVYRIHVRERTTLRIEVEGDGYEPGVVITRADPAGVSGKYLPIAAGGRHTCAISAGEVFCWGADDRGQLGDGGALGAADSTAAVQVLGITSAQSVCAGAAHACAVTEDGRVRCWGEGAQGRLGNGLTAAQTSPVLATGIGPGEALGPAAQVTCGDAFSCALLRDGRVACFGANNVNQLGDGTTTERRTAVVVAGGERYEQVDAGARHACAVRASDDAIFCWGEGAFGKLGDGATANNAVPARAGTLIGATYVMAGGDHTCASLSSGRVHCWGRNQVGQLGRGSTGTGNQTTPIAVRNADGSADLANVRGGMAAGASHTCVATLEGFVMCWGGNAQRQIGHNQSAGSVTRPIGVHNVLDAVQVASAGDHTCAVRASGVVVCWGGNADGQLGDGTTTTPAVPVRSQAGSGGAAVAFGDGTVDAAFTQACRSAGQPPEAGCELRARNGHNYYFCDGAQHGRTWAGAAQACEAIGMQLASIDEPGENAFIASHLEGSKQAWLGIKRETDDSWLNLGDEPHFENLNGERVWYTERTSFLGGVVGVFTGPAAPDLVGSKPRWTSSSTWARNEPSGGHGENCVTIDRHGEWRTEPCSAVPPPQRNCGLFGLFCLFSALSDLVGGILDWIVPWVADLTRVVFDSLAGRYASPQFSGGVTHGYVCEEVRRSSDVTLDPGDYYVTVKGIDDGIAGNACEGGYELTLTDLGASGGGLIACDDNGVAETATSAIERTLTTGDYYLILKGKRPQDMGDYTLTVRDVGAVPETAIACDAGTGASDPASTVIAAEPGHRYYAVVKGDGPLDKGPFSLQVGDADVFGGDRIGCATSSGDLSLALPEGSYYAVLKGRGASAAGAYQLSIGGAVPEAGVFEPPTYSETIAALHEHDVRVGVVVACDPSLASCEEARAQGEQLARETGGAIVAVASAADAPAQVVRVLEQVTAADRIAGELLFMPDLNPGFNPYGVTAIADPGNRCTPGSDGSSFVDCAPGATPAFRVSLHNPLLAPVGTALNALGLYQFTLRVTTERTGATTEIDEIPIYVRPSGAPEPGSFSLGEYFQDFSGSACALLNERRRMEDPARPTAPLVPSWDQLRFNADVPPDTRVTFYACGAGTEAELDDCGSAERKRRVVTLTAGSGAGRSCTEATQATDCPGGYCSPYIGVCQYLEGVACTHDANCPGTGSGRCRPGPSAAALGNTCRVDDLIARPSDALGPYNLPHVRMYLALESLGPQNRAPSVFQWEARYNCRTTE